MISIFPSARCGGGRQTDKETGIATYGLNRPKGRFSTMQSRVTSTMTKILTPTCSPPPLLKLTCPSPVLPSPSMALLMRAGLLLLLLNLLAASPRLEELIKINPLVIKITPPDIKINHQDIKINPQHIKINPQDQKINPQDIKITPQDININPQDIKMTPLESLLLHSQELDISPAEVAGSSLDREQMVWRRKRGGLLQPDWLIWMIQPEKTDMDRIFGYMIRLVREKELLRLRSLSGQEILERRTGNAQN